MITNVAFKRHELLFYFSTPSQPTQCIDGIGSKAASGEALRFNQGAEDFKQFISEYGYGNVP
ncbi:MAG: hypothetical protein CMI66_05615 [Pedosphaera sp.]|nr:hypothetical protein [Pedosphaera sp.]|tara:strand:- start:328 stop:513 length:186 start_codon:yes stop_codon:yes gene_type:complete